MPQPAASRRAFARVSRLRLPTLTLRIRVTLLFCSVVLLLGIVAVMYAQRDMRRILSEELELRVQAIAQDLAANSADALLTGDLVALYDLANRAKIHNRDVRYVLILDSAGRVRVNTFGDVLPRGLLAANAPAADSSVHLRRIETEEGLMRDAAASILGGQAGVVRVGVLNTGVEAAVARNTRGLAALVAAAVIVGLIVACLLSYYLTRSLSRLVEAVQSVTRGDFTPRIPSPSRDEVGRLGEAFNTMAGELQNKERARLALMDKVISSQEEERRRIARELHDDLAQQLTSVLLSLEAVEHAHGEGDRGFRQAIRKARQVTAGSLAGTRRLIGDLRPTVLDDLGLLPAIRSYAEDHLRSVGISVAVSAEALPATLPPPVETAVFRIVQEAVSNVARHAHASTTRIGLRARHGCLEGDVADDGCGLGAAAHRTDGLGLKGMEERAAVLGGVLSVRSGPDRGTQVRFSIPLHQAAPHG